MTELPQALKAFMPLLLNNQDKIRAIPCETHQFGALERQKVSQLN
jgi:hypothetical protein